MPDENMDKDIADATAALTLQMVQQIADNAMPECFATSRPLLVAMARMLMVALAQNEAMIAEQQTGKVNLPH